MVEANMAAHSGLLHLHARVTRARPSTQWLQLNQPIGLLVHNKTTFKKAKKGSTVCEV